MTKDEEKTEELHAFASISNNKTSHSVGTQPPELENRDGELKMKPLHRFMGGK